jgi:HK97 family phage portal protein
LGIVSRIKAETRDNSGTGLVNPAQWFRDWFGGGPPSSTGININEDTAVKLVAVFACVRLLSESIAMLPFPMYKSLKVGKEKAVYHPLYTILHDIANPECTSFQFRQIMMVNALLCGSACAEIQRDESGNVIALWPIPTKYIQLTRNSNTKELVYQVNNPDGSQSNLYPEQVFSLPGMGFDNVKTFKPIQLAREAIGLGLATQEFGARFFGQGTTASGIVEYPGKMSDKAYDRYTESFAEKYEGLKNSNRLVFLEEGLKFTQLTIPPENAQFLETRKFQVIEMARFFNVPPHMIMDFDGATFSNIEQKSLEYVTYSLMPWFVKWEQAVYKCLLMPSERKKFFAKFSVDALLRGDFSTRMNGYHMMIQDGVWNADEIRELEDMNPQPDEQGQIYLCNGNMIPKNMAGKIKGGGNGGTSNPAG